MFDQILVPLDGSSLSESSLPHAKAIAKCFDAKLILLRVVGPEPGISAATLGGSGARLAKAEASAYLRQIGKRLSIEGIPFQMIVEEGPAAQRIVDVARREQANLVILTGSRGSPVAVDAGRTGRDVVAAAPASVMMVRPGQTATDEQGYQRVLVPVDGSKRGEWAMCLAASLARYGGAELVLLFVLAAPEILEDEEVSDAAVHLRERVRAHNGRVASQYLSRMAKQLEAPDLKIDQRLIEDSDVARAIEATARDVRADLVVASAHGHSAHVGSNYGSKSRRLIDEGAHTTLVLQDLPVRHKKAESPRRLPRRPRGSVGATLP